MRCFVNYISRRKKGVFSLKTEELDCPVIRIGRATNQEIFLSDIRVAYQHAEIIKGEDGLFYIHSLALPGIKVNQLATKSAQLTPGLVIHIGGYQLTVLPPSGDFDLEIEAEQLKLEASLDKKLLEEAKIDLSKSALNKRLWSWGAFLIILLLFFLIPLSGSLIKPVKSVLSAIPGIPSDNVWSTGELDSAHHFFKDDCRKCHQTPFISVKDTACVECHSKTHKHAKDKDMLASGTNETQCQKCHKEHNGPSNNILKSDKFCTDCHSDISDSLGNETELHDVSDFGTEHPEFRPTIMQLDAEGVTKFKRISLDDTAALKENHTLIFSHKAHLKPEKPERFKEKTKDGRDKLNCGDCHIPDSGGVHMEPINFQKLCRDCHELTVGIEGKDRDLPHGDPAEVFFYIQQYYNSIALKGGAIDQTAPQIVRRRRRPGERRTPSERLEALDWAEKKSREVANSVFKFTTCKDCHQVSYTFDNEASPWKFSKVHIPRRWLPLANFNHAKHLTRECDSCHKVIESEDGKDVLLPKIDSCRECHQGANDTELLASTCVDCHSFHIGDELLGKPKLQSAAKSSDQKPE